MAGIVRQAVRQPDPRHQRAELLGSGGGYRHAGRDRDSYSLGLHAARSLGFAEAAPAVESAQAKLERVMPSNLKSCVRAVSETTTLDLSAGAAPDDNAALVAMTSAAQARRRVHFNYRSATGVATERDFDPYGLVYRESRWYVGGHCHLRGGLRSFRLDRMRDVRSLEANFERPADFNALAHLTFSIATIPRLHAVEILLHADLKTAIESLSPGLGLFEPQGDAVCPPTRAAVVSLQYPAAGRTALVAARARAPPAATSRLTR